MWPLSVQRWNANPNPNPDPNPIPNLNFTPLLQIRAILHIRAWHTSISTNRQSEASLSWLEPWKSGAVPCWSIRQRTPRSCRALFHRHHDGGRSRWVVRCFYSVALCLDTTYTSRLSSYLRLYRCDAMLRCKAVVFYAVINRLRASGRRTDQ